MTSVLVVFYLADRGACHIVLVVFTLLTDVIVIFVLVVLYLADRGACDIRTGCVVPC